MIEYATLALASLLVIVYLIFIARRIREERCLVRLTDSEKSHEDALISIIIPARNEAETISRCIEGVLSQRGFKKEVIIVDDSSEDETTLIVLKNYLSRGVKLVRVSERSDEWIGKSWACHVGYTETSGDWLLFIDADASFMDEYVVRDTLTYAINNKIDALSLIPMLETDTTASRIMLPTLTALKYVLAPPRRSNDPRDKLSFFYGSYMLFRRRVYESIGGHRAVRKHILEDKALGELTKSMGYRVALLDGRRRMRARFNDTMHDYMNALLRLFTEYAESSGIKKVWKYIIGGIVFLILPIVLAAYALISLNLVLSLPFFLMFFAQAYELRKLEAPIHYFPLVAVSAIVIISMLLVVGIRYVRGGVKLEWKGRQYIFKHKP